MTRRWMTAVMAIALVTAPAVCRAAELAGVTVADKLEVAGKTLVLNGAGLRKKAFFQIYVGALYLESASKDGSAILATEKSKAVSMHFLRALGRDQLTGAFRDDFAANAGADAAAQQASVDRFLAMIPDVAVGDELTFAYAPGTGTTVSHNGKAAGTIEGDAFSRVLFAAWLGSVPPTQDLKNGMLGL